MSKGYIVHKAVELDKVKKKLRPSEGQLRSEYLCQPKYDGCNIVAVKHAHDVEMVFLYSRTGEEVKSAKHIEEAIAAAPFMPCGVYLGEYWHPHIDQATVSGKFRDTKQQHTEPMMVVFDYLTLEEWDQGHSEIGYAERTARIPVTFSKVAECKAPVFLAESQGFLVDQELGVDEAAKLMCSSGAYDGIILRKPSGLWKKGDLGTSGEIIKVKPTLTLDLQVMRVNKAVGEKTGRDVYTIVVALPNGYEQEIGSGVPHNFIDVPDAAAIVEIEAMCYSKNGLLREPRFKSIRYDKTEPDRE